MLDRKRNIIIILCILCLLIILPPIIYGYVYPTGGDDSAEHLKVIEQITLINPIPASGYHYAGELIVGYPLVVLKMVFHIPLTTSFTWFNYLALIGVVLTFYCVFSKTFNKQAGLLAAVGIFAVQTFVAQYLSGLIFNIINIGIILMWFIYFGIRAWTKRSWKRGVVAVALLLLFANFHSSGLYLPIMPHSILRILGIIHDSSESGLVSNPNVIANGITIQYIIFTVLYLTIIGSLIYFWKKISANASKEGRLMMIVLGVMSVELAIVSMPALKISPYPSRQLVDTVTFVFLLVVGAVSLYMSKASETIKSGVLLAVILLVSVLWLPTWFSNTSAIKPVDKQAIAYVNSLDGKQFCGNEYLASWVYERYLNKTYEPKSNIYIWRSAPMTMRTNPQTEWYNNNKNGDISLPIITSLDGYKWFNGDGIDIIVFQGDKK